MQSVFEIMSVKFFRL